MGTLKPFYSSLVEFEEAVKALGLTDQASYRKACKRDPRLPTHPGTLYKDWRGWAVLFRTDFYETLSEAAVATRLLGIETQRAYLRQYKRDRKLPSNPPSQYRNWISWEDFLGVKPPSRNQYLTIYEASLAANKLGFKSGEEYKKHYHLDPKLPGTPSRYYRDYWYGWSSFLSGTVPINVYSEIEQASDAARSLNITTEAAYLDKYRADPYLPSSPETIYKQEWKGWDHFINISTVENYSSLIEVEEAAQKLGIKSKAQYDALCYKDEKLPLRPDVAYSEEWGGWTRLLRLSRSSNLYRRIEDAQWAVFRLGITSFRQYQSLRKQDSRLPASPYAFYKNQWEGWPSFLIPPKVSLLAHVAHAAKVLNVTSAHDYMQKYKEFCRLPSHPERMFVNEWVGWNEFLGVMPFYVYAEASELVKLAGVRTINEYKSFVAKSKDQRLPNTPHEVYCNEWTNWHNFLGKQEPYILANIRPPYSRWRDVITEFKKGAKGGASKENGLCRFVRDYIQKYNLGNSPEEFLTNGRVDVRPFIKMLVDKSSGRAGQWLLTSVNELLSYVIKHHLTEEDEETGELVVAMNALNPCATIQLKADDAPRTLDESNKLALAYHFVMTARNWMLPPDAQSFSDLKHLHEYDSDWIDIDERLIDYTDSNCVIRNYGERIRIWCPIHWIHTYAITAIPARGRQIAYNDSGEGDADILDFAPNRKPIWLKNDHVLAGTTREQGFIKMYPDQELGMHFTTNKTSSSAYDLNVPWIPSELAYWLVQLRKWQTKYNPIIRVMPWMECQRTALNESQRRAKGANCFLFRDFGSEECGTFSNRISTRLAAALFNTQPNGLALSTCHGSPRALNSYTSPYSPHSMRVSLITAYVLDFGLPMSIVMKIVGHSSIVMSVYYVKVNAESLRKRFEAGEKIALRNKAAAVQSMLEQNRVDEIRHEFVANSEEALSRLRVSGPGGFLFRDYGVCPYAGSRCGDGGELIGLSGVRSPVKNGYLGQQNCPQCRHFLTGPVFLGGLISLQNEISLQARVQYEKYSHIESMINELNDAINASDDEELLLLREGKKFDSGDRNVNESRLRKLRSELEGAAMKIDVFLCDIQYIAKLTKQSEALLNQQVKQEESSNLPQIIFQSGHEIHLVAEETSNFHQLSEVCENAEIYESASASLALPSRSQMLDKMLLLNDFSPVMCLLDAKQQLAIGNQLTNLVLSRLKSWERVDALISGEIHMVDLSEDERITAADFKELFRSDLKKIR
ncbi:gamma-mobile-trio integrase GmtZ [Pseudomonas azerbaijanoccidentalis]